MNNPPPSAESIFADAIELPSGDARARFVTARCGDNTVLLCEVESLLRAHDNAGEFLAPPPPRVAIRTEELAVATQGTAIMNPAAHAEAFLRGFSNPTAEQREQFIAQLPEAVRQEVR